MQLPPAARADGNRGMAQLKLKLAGPTDVKNMFENGTN
jgi:hypothetical protein